MHNPRVKKWVKNEGVTIFGMQSLSSTHIQ